LCYVAFVNVYVSSALTFKDNFRMRLKFSAFMVLPMTIALPTSANALGEYWSGGFTPANVNPVNWIQDVSISSSYSSSYVIPGVNAWNTVSSKVRVNKVISGSVNVRVAVANGGDKGVTGQMFPYCPAGSSATCVKLPDGTASSQSTWASAKVVGYEDAMTQNGWTGTNIIQTFTHEFGHALSMSHSISTATMSPYGPSNLSVQAYDKANLKAKWGN
jgi:hypothetical protein